MNLPILAAVGMALLLASCAGPAGLHHRHHRRRPRPGQAYPAEHGSVSPAKSGNRGLVRRRLRLTRNPDIPSVLVEFGYLSHPAEARLCGDPAYRERMAGAVARAILDQQAKGDAGTGPRPRPIYAPPSRPTDPPGS